MTVTIGKRVKLFRTNLKLTQPQASERAGISQATWSRIETDQKTPTAGEVLGLSWALGVPFDTVLGKSAIRDRARFAARCSAAVSPSDAAVAADIKEKMLFLAEYAAELTESGHLISRGR
jgi:transcriptional regulator with XRE-family HTH domain